MNHLEQIDQRPIRPTIPTSLRGNRTERRWRWIVLFCTGLSLLCNYALAAETSSADEANLDPNLTINKGEPILSRAGYFHLEWGGAGTASSEEKLDYILEESLSSDFSTRKILFHGGDTASTISGKPDGAYYYRICRVRSDLPADQVPTEADADKCGPILRAEVRHHSLIRAFSFLGAGFIVFLSTALLIILGGRHIERSSRT